MSVSYIRTGLKDGPLYLTVVEQFLFHTELTFVIMPLMAQWQKYTSILGCR